MTTHLSTTDYAALIRKSLKTKYRWTGRDVSVRASYASNCSSIAVRVKNPDVPLNVVREIAEMAESISRCEITGDILSGGNRYVSVEYSHEVRMALRDQFAPAVAAALAQVGDSQHSLAKIAGTRYSIGRDGSQYLVIFGGERSLQCYDARAAAETVGVLVASESPATPTTSAALA